MTATATSAAPTKGDAGRPRGHGFTGGDIRAIADIAAFFDLPHRLANGAGRRSDNEFYSKGH
ncbi:MAG: hypothetical protein ACK5IP_16225 [Paracoccus sp. (in: a-proteobacteria)]